MVDICISEVTIAWPYFPIILIQLEKFDLHII